MKKFLFFTLVLELLFSITLKANNLNPAKNLVSVAIAPQAFFVKQIAADTLNINIILEPNSHEHNLEFKPSIMKKLEKSDIYFSLDLEFEKVFIPKFKQNFPKLQIINMQKNITLLQDQDGHEDFDPHTWLDPILVQNMALTIYEALSQTYPQNKDLYKENLDKFLSKLDSLNLQIASKLEKSKHKEFVVYHPSWTYFAKRYKLRQVPVEVLGKEPKTKDLQNLITLVKDKNIKVIFVQKNFPKNAAKTLAKECEAKLYQIDHLAYDWENELLKTAQVLANDL